MSETGKRKSLVFLTGGTGFVGRHVARRLVERGNQVRALVRDRDAAQVLQQLGADLVIGDITKDENLREALTDCSSVVHLVGIIREKPPAVTFEEVHIRGTMRVLEAAESAGVQRFIFMSALGAKREGTAYHRSKFEAEEVIRRSSMPYVIFQPSIIAGEGGEFVRLLMRLLRSLPIVPVIGDGQYRLQPVAVEDVASAFAKAVERNDILGQTLEIGGPHKLTYNRLLGIVSEELGVRRLRLHVPLTLVKPFIDLASNWRLPTPINSDELSMLLEENVVHGDADTLREVFGIEPLSFRTVLQQILAPPLQEE